MKYADYDFDVYAQIVLIDYCVCRIVIVNLCLKENFCYRKIPNLYICLNMHYHFI